MWKVERKWGVCLVGLLSFLFEKGEEREKKKGGKERGREGPSFVIQKKERGKRKEKKMRPLLEKEKKRKGKRIRPTALGRISKKEKKKKSKKRKRKKEVLLSSLQGKKKRESSDQKKGGRGRDCPLQGGGEKKRVKALVQKKKTPH